jgi:CRP-like cAMP-binding protein
MLNDRKRRYTAVANKDTTLLLIDQPTVEKQMAMDTPLVRLVVLVLLKRLELMNRLRMVKDRG